MSVKFPDSCLFKEKIEKDCNVTTKLAACAFTKNGHIIAVDTNRTRLGDKRQRTYHAEAFLLKKLHKIKAFHRYKKVYILVLKWRPFFQDWSMARPCVACQRLLRHSGVYKVFYSDWDGNVQSIGL